MLGGDICLPAVRTNSHRNTEMLSRRQDRHGNKRSSHEFNDQIHQISGMFNSRAQELNRQFPTVPSGINEST